MILIEAFPKIRLLFAVSILKKRYGIPTNVTAEKFPCDNGLSKDSNTSPVSVL